ncbi:MAG: hypothetical protein FD126_3087, partial [Elusimicrobia bacterium]
MRLTRPWVCVALLATSALEAAPPRPRAVAVYGH